jgi:chorismate synthase
MAVEKQDSLGGIVECTVRNMPVGLGEPFFDSVESVLGHIIFSIPAIKGVEFGSGFAAARMWGSEHNDRLISVDGKTATNFAGGINGGISNGNDLLFRVAIKPTSSMHQKQKTLNVKTGEMIDLEIEGRHDTCIALRVPVVVEAATAVVLADFMMQEGIIRRRL